jgi:hypothetical protein
MEPESRRSGVRCVLGDGCVSAGRSGGAKISARRGFGFPQEFVAPDLSCAVDDPPRSVSKLPRPTTRWAMQRARMAQIRRGYDMGGGDRNPRRDLRPTAPQLTNFETSSLAIPRLVPPNF